MNTKKIAVLEKAIHMLENGEINYKWLNSMACNNGSVLQAIGLPNDAEHRTLYKSWMPNIRRKLIEAGERGLTYSAIIKYSEDTCQVTGLPFSDIQKAMLDHGFSRTDIMNLEYLQDKDVLARLGVEILEYDSKPNLILYLKAWIELLKEHEGKSPEIKERIVYVAVPESISKQAKELILS